LRSKFRRLRPDGAAKADVARRRVDGLALTGGWAVAQAVVRRAKVGASLDHASLEGRCVRPSTEALVGAFVARVLRDAAGVRDLGRADAEDVGRPLPDIAGHVEQAVTIGPE
jgi:hypothetical protein